MEIKITRIDDEVEIQFFSGKAEKEQMGYSDIVVMLLSALDGATKPVLEECSDTEREKLYDYIDAVFGSFLVKNFPEINPEEFTLTDAAIVKAQDDIINEAFDKGMSLQDALEKYENLAAEYVAQRRLN